MKTWTALDAPRECWPPKSSPGGQNSACAPRDDDKTRLSQAALRTMLYLTEWRGGNVRTPRGTSNGNMKSKKKHIFSSINPDLGNYLNLQGK